MEERKRGHVLWFSDAKGYGFICPENYNPGDNDIFFYYAYLQMEGFKTIKPDVKVTFEVSKNHHGPMAVNIMFENDAEEEYE